jgi:4-hydroxythreonine-4-phosphate dehydrogenase
MKKIAISIGDLNGIGLEIALKSHNKIKKLVKPIYCINEEMLKQGTKLLNMKTPDDFEIYPTAGKFEIKIGKNDSKAGLYSFNSFIDAINLAKNKKTDGICTLPINKESWAMANIKYHGHTEVLRDVFKKHAIMMLGCSEMFVSLFTEHIPIRDISKNIKKDKLISFFIDFYNAVKTDKIGVLALNPHAGDGGILGNEEIEGIIPAIQETNKLLNKKVFEGPFVPDTYFINPYKYTIAMYHDQGLIPLKAKYFDKSINVSLNLPILRTSVDHGTAFDIAYKNKAKIESYIEAIKYHLGEDK